MQKKSFLFFLFFLSVTGVVSLGAYVQTEMLFNRTFVVDPVDRVACVTLQGKPVFTILSVSGGEDFAKKILQNSLPVVVHVFSKTQHPLVRDVYRHAAQHFSGKVAFVGVDVDQRENFEIIRNIMVPLGVSVITVPFFLLFKQNNLLLPPVVFPEVGGGLPQEKLENLQNNFIEHITNEFFEPTDSAAIKASLKPRGSVSRRGAKVISLSKGSVCVLPDEICRLDAKHVPEQKEASTWQKIMTLSKKMKRWLATFSGISAKQMRAYQLSRKGGR